MPRLSFNSILDRYSGEGASPSRVHLDSGESRRVQEHQIVDTDGPFASVASYVTLDYVEPSAPLFAGSYPTHSVDFSSGDVLNLPAGSSLWYQVAKVQEITPVLGPPYYRAYLLPVIPGQDSMAATCPAGAGRFMFHNVSKAASGSGTGSTYCGVSVVDGRAYSLEITAASRPECKVDICDGPCGSLGVLVNQTGVGSTPFDLSGFSPTRIRVGNGGFSGAWSLTFRINMSPP